ncbi:unnamed protein product [Cochlearia groenlandica]
MGQEQSMDKLLHHQATHNNVENNKSLEHDQDPKRKKQSRRRLSYVSQARRWAQVDRQTKGDTKKLNWSCDACKRNTNQMNASMILQTSQATTTTSPQGLTLSVTPLRAIEEEEEEEDGSIHYPLGVCVICVDASSDAACVPCGHVAGCISCLKEIKEKEMGCPVCRANIDQVIKLYHV